MSWNTRILRLVPTQIVYIHSYVELQFTHEFYHFYPWMSLCQYIAGVHYILRTGERRRQSDLSTSEEKLGLIIIKKESSSRRYISIYIDPIIKIRHRKFVITSLYI